MLDSICEEGIIGQDGVRAASDEPCYRSGDVGLMRGRSAVRDEVCRRNGDPMMQSAMLQPWVLQAASRFLNHLASQ
jgi:hypothetical protein